MVCLCVHAGVCLCVCAFDRNIGLGLGIVSLLAGCGESDGEGIEEGGWVVLGRAGVWEGVLKYSMEKNYCYL